ncbi:hypothetical protein BO78DRAFT_313643 [Aspergillus sclerotiicarbonarius CBS 121057]|uniref:Zn(2)-C6 fungal-type domain-containing protein n=1 Tax=Aspergillus sclerotiicarbonarius (strain CBS 121057 / IBT 28362) TaxID=1448318 RepID=A0A319EC55_ASPSB|nr:hypothetical protein BO78DRAFT_313643 [Aspergillus sclerotiicarbonarius CBS 121057]
MLHPRLSLVCDNCKGQKVRCLSMDESSSSDSVCINCHKRGRECVYSPLKRKFRDSTTEPIRDQTATGILPEAEDRNSIESTLALADFVALDVQAENVSANHYPVEPPRDDQAHKLYVDHLLDTRQPIGRTQNASSILRANENYLASSSISFFPESRVKALSSQIGTDSVESLIDRISQMVRSRLDGSNSSHDISKIWEDSKEPVTIEAKRASSFINTYFQHIHPLHPFLDREEFETRAGKSDLQSDLSNSISWCALYHAILAIGCQFQGEGSFQPVRGEAWRYFRVALSLFPKILLLSTGLLEVQAVTSMAIFSLNLSCLQIQGKIVSEAARMVQRADFNKIATGTDETARCRVFWVVYYIEKTVAFYHGSTSLLFDYDIGTPVPMIPEAIFDGFDWFLTSLRIARLYSRVFEELFSINATTGSKDFYLSKIDRIEKILEHHRLTIPMEFRPNEKLPSPHFMEPHMIMAAIRVHLHYHELRIALCRLKLHVSRGQLGQESVATKRMMDSARAVIQLTRLTRIEAATPLYILIFMPLSALLILFDLVIHNPSHPETRRNLNLLEAAAGHFSSLEYATEGNLPSSMLVEFAYIARSFTEGDFLRNHHISGRNRSRDEVEQEIHSSFENWRPNTDTIADVSAKFMLTDDYLFI